MSTGDGCATPHCEAMAQKVVYFGCVLGDFYGLQFCDDCSIKRRNITQPFHCQIHRDICGGLAVVNVVSLEAVGCNGWVDVNVLYHRFLSNVGIVREQV